MNKEVIEVLKKGKAVLADPRAWTQGSPARDKFGAPVSVEKGEDACCWCAVGALSGGSKDACPDVINEGWRFLLAAVHVHNRFMGVGTYNDDPERTHADILSLYDAAIIMAEKKEAEKFPTKEGV